MVPCSGAFDAGCRIESSEAVSMAELEAMAYLDFEALGRSAGESRNEEKRFQKFISALLLLFVQMILMFSSLLSFMFPISAVVAGISRSGCPSQLHCGLSDSLFLSSAFLLFPSSRICRLDRHGRPIMSWSPSISRT